MINKERISELKTDLCKQINQNMKSCNFNLSSYDVHISTASKVSKYADGRIESLLSMADNMDCDVCLVVRDK